MLQNKNRNRIKKKIIDSRQRLQDRKLCTDFLFILKPLSCTKYWRIICWRTSNSRISLELFKQKRRNRGREAAQFFKAYDMTQKQRYFPFSLGQTGRETETETEEVLKG